ncbi:unnamed protein product, partial [Mesorhabditis belari]|uniref:Uncharacterized protein n=1 Tax=Mesorhabditis belari TaxID=2138241 RepID=A0AAF3ERW4_9BILA
MKVSDVDLPVPKFRRRDSKRKEDEVKEWSEIPSSEKRLFIIATFLRLLTILFILFVYICSLAQIATAFSLIGSFGLGHAIKDSPLLQDPISGLILGMVTTVVLQSPTATVTVLVSMVAANMITVHTAIPVMIGSELGSSLINSFVSMAYSGNKEQFRRAFAAATLPDVFNFCTLIIILPLELFTSVIEKTSWLIVDPLVSEKGLTFKTLDYITDPINKLVLQVNEAEIRNATIARDYFSPDHTFVNRCVFPNGSRIANCPYKHIFAYSSLSDMWIGVIIVVVSVLSLILCLCGIVHLITKMLAGRLAVPLRKALDKEVPRPFSFLTGYIIMFIGMVVTLLLQSNSIFSSSLTPLVGIAVLAAMSADEARFEKTLHMAMCSVIYNVMGTTMFYVIPWTRKVPIFLCKRLGNATAEYRWFILIYIIGLFIILPAIVFALSLGPDFLLYLFLAELFGVIALIGFINYLQVRFAKSLPPSLRTWKCVPRCFRSFRFWDAFFMRCFGGIPLIGRFIRAGQEENEPTETDSVLSADFIDDPPLPKVNRFSRSTVV